jgi:uncharacterized protein YodC (DUF2158 family)
MSRILNEGDRVRLMSGGPDMTVINAQGAAGEVWCIWTVGDRVARDAFPTSALEKIVAAIAG